MTSPKSILLINLVLYFVFFTSLVFSLRAISSLSIGLLCIAGMVKNKIEKKPLFDKNMKCLFLGACVLLYIYHFAALLYTDNIQEGWNDIRMKAGLIFTPVALLCTGFINSTRRKFLLNGYCLMLAMASLYCLGIAFYRYQETGKTFEFFYHALVNPIRQHAVYFSVLIAIALVFLFESLRKKATVLNKPTHILLLLFFSVFLFLLSSKLIIVLYLAYLLFFGIFLIAKRKAARALAIGSFILFIIIGSLIFKIRNPVSDRFHELATADINIVNKDQFDPGKYFNGLEFRLLQWKFVTEILTENHRWWTGVSPGDGQAYLNQKYVSARMYTGDPATGKQGYLVYNTHNQFLETLLQTGLVGLLILIVLCFAIAKMALRTKNRTLPLVTFLLFSWMLTESVFETQYGIMIFTFFPLFFYFGERKVHLPEKSADES